MRKAWIWAACAAPLVFSPAQTAAQVVKIVGLGAATCATFGEDISRTPDLERVYFAWAQGYMNGLLIRAPDGQDENVDLTPRQFGLQAQLGFLRTFCLDNPNANFSDGIHGLYQVLRTRR
jgi:hypothetical protein